MPKKPIVLNAADDDAQYIALQIRTFGLAAFITHLGNIAMNQFNNEADFEFWRLAHSVLKNFEKFFFPWA